MGQSRRHVLWPQRACALRILKTHFTFWSIDRTWIRQHAETKAQTARKRSPCTATPPPTPVTSFASVAFSARGGRPLNSGAVTLTPPNLGTGDDNAYAQGRSWVKTPLKHVYDVF
jgi:hypothetical protein